MDGEAGTIHAFLQMLSMYTCIYTPGLIMTNEEFEPCSLTK